MSLVLAACVLAGGCATVGPRAIRSGRVNYNEALLQTWNEQLLLNLVRLRYGETPLFLDVSSVSTQYNLGAALGVNPAATYGAGRPSTYDVDLDTGVSYSERPTITYSPLQGKDFVKRLLSPIPLESLLLLAGSGWGIDRVLRTCVQRMNDLWNAPDASGPRLQQPPEYRDFKRAARLMRQLQRARAFDLAVEYRLDQKLVSMQLAPDGPTDQSEDLRALLGLAPGTQSCPVTFGGPGGVQQLALVTRSLQGVLFYLAYGVEVPAADEEAGRVTVIRDTTGRRFKWAAVTGDLLRIHSQSERPADAFTRVYYRGAWFFIRNDDLESKATFGLLTQLFNLQAGDVPDLGPVLTLPIGG